MSSTKKKNQTADQACEHNYDNNSLDQYRFTLNIGTNLINKFII